MGFGAGCNTPSFPRIRGDVPLRFLSGFTKPEFSPHTRGCSGDVRDSKADRMVFPAYAGMFLIELSFEQVETSFPRIRGDVPMGRSWLARVRSFSPHTRGCSAPVPFSMYRSIVFPAYAGMFPPLWKP